MGLLAAGSFSVRFAALMVVGSLVAISPLVAQQRGPSDVPAAGAKRGLRLNSEAAFSGYTLISPLKDTTTYLLDMHGQVAHTWASDLAPGNSVYLKPNGNLLRAGRPENNPLFHGGGEGGRIREYNWQGDLLWEMNWNDEEKLHHHDFELLPNGNLLLIAWEAKTAIQAAQRGRRLKQDEKEGFWPDYVVEIKPDGKTGAEVVWEWHTWDHLIQHQDPKLPNFGNPAMDPGRIDINADAQRQQLSAAEQKRLQELGYLNERDTAKDAPKASADWMHTNGIDYNAEHDLILLSVRRMNEIWIIDHSTTSAEAASESGGNFGRGGALLFRWGNPQAYGRGTAEDQELFGQHDARWIPAGYPGAGNITVFDNGSKRTQSASDDAKRLKSGPDSADWSRVIELTPSWNHADGFAMDDDGCFGPEKLTWSYTSNPKADFYSSFISGAERLPNGNTLICEGDDGRVFEVNADGKIVWEYWNEHGRQDVGQRGDPKPASDAKAAAPPNGPPRGGGGPQPKALFRASRIAFDFPGVAALTQNPK
ncbi:MAG: aryl-sulfate sulfotransferase [Planctomycetes bacterium]|nr:aryl-sulfate sulfotransferase [Planctomycetota bacterium]